MAGTMAVTDGWEQLRYLAGADANAVHAQRLQAGDEAFRAGVRQRYLGD